MAHSARLHLRMQKEIKLLATDPPPGVSIPSLSNHSYSDSSFSFSTIDARIEGPEGTVYAKGVFNIKIQIPDRYPFQPPKVTFSTPIYHPNIDNGGRICLDILNLPPKGAWQPSLNISTVLTSIGLLLSEPNPDDGLVCEASREYKYNRQAFDQKARSWTERYAKPGAVDGSSSRGLVNIPNMVEAESTEMGSSTAADEATSCYKMCRIGGKFSVEMSMKKRSSDDRDDAIQNDNKENIAPVRRLSLRLPETSKPMKLLRSGNIDDNPRPFEECAGKTTNAIAEQKNKVSDASKRESLDSERPPSLLQASCCDSQSLSLTSSSGKPANAIVEQKAKLPDNPVRYYADSEKFLPLLRADSSEEQSNSLDHCRKPMNAISEPILNIPATVVVSDSEGSDEELERPARSRLSLGRTRATTGWKYGGSDR